jgi:CHAT domain-containing protein
MMVILRHAGGALLAIVAVAGCGERLPCAEVARASELHDRHEDAEALGLVTAVHDDACVADALQLAGKIHAAAGRRDDAQRVLDEALRRHRARGAHVEAFTDARLLVDSFIAQGRLVHALEMTEVERSEADAANDPALRARALLGTGTVLHVMGDDARALDVYAEAAAHLPANDGAGRARLLLRRGTLLGDQRQDVLAAQVLEEARALAARAGEPARVLEAEIEVDLSDIALRDHRLDDAQRHLEAALASRRALGRTGPASAILINQAILARGRGQLAAAEHALSEVAAADDSAEVSWLVADERGRIAATRGAADEAERRYREAIGIVERMRNEAAPEQVRAAFLEARWAPYEDLFAAQLDRGHLREAFATLAQAQGRMFLDTFAAAAADASPADYAVTRSAARRMTALGALGTALANSPIGAFAGVDPTLAAARHEHTLLYFAGAGQMRLLVIRNGVLERANVAIDVGELERRIDELVAAPGDRDHAAALGRVLLPEAALPAGPARIRVIPTGPLLRLPFAALIVGGVRLLDRYEIVYSPSVAAAVSAAPASNDMSAGQPVVIADARRDLAHADTEVRVLVDIAGAVTYTGPRATRAALRDSAGTPLLHIVGHSGVSGAGGYLVLADGEVTAADIVSWRLSPRLVVMPTCASAASHRSEMWDSLATAFLAAGSRHVIATLTSVKDAVAVEFSIELYRQDPRRDPVAATARALRALAARRPVADWAPFIIAAR